jgi:plastocyanin
MRMTRRSGAVGLLVAGALLLAACGGSPKSSAPAASGGSRSSGGDAITISNYMFSPMSITVAPGATVKVTNKDAVTHTLTATGGQFNTGDISSNRTKSFTAPNKAGKYNYICSIHQYMMGTITVS